MVLGERLQQPLLSATVESTSTRDFLDISAWFVDDGAAPALIQEFRSRIHAIDLRRETRRGTSVYNGVFNLLVLEGARDWMKGTVPQYGDLDDHHIVPRDWSGQHQEVRGLIDSILNRTPLTAETNRHVIRNRLPNEYLPELIDQSGEPTVRAILSSHFISATAFDILLRTPFTAADFEAFLAERQRTIENGIERLVFDNAIDLPADLRKLDDRVREVELRLRSLLSDRLDEDVARLPSHIRDKIGERIGAAASKDSAFDPTLYETMAGQLEYADLRELQAAITNKAIWPNFAETFPNKETLASRFDQLAELRNSIRHNRTVTEIVSKEGEAALLWFESKLP